MLQDLNDLWEIAEYIGDPQLTEALEFVAKLIVQPEQGLGILTYELIRLQAIAAKLKLRAVYLANVDKSDRPRKNLLYAAADELDKVCSALKYGVK